MNPPPIYAAAIVVALRGARPVCGSSKTQAKAHHGIHPGFRVRTQGLYHGSALIGAESVVLGVATGGEVAS